MIWVFYSQHWHYWKSKIMNSSVRSSWPQIPVILTQVFTKITMDSRVSDTHSYLDYKNFSYRIVPKKGCILWLTTTSFQVSLVSDKFMTPYSGPYIALRQPLISPLLSVIAFNVQNFGLRARASQPFQLIPAFNPLKFMAADIQGSLSKSWCGFQYIIFIANRFTKLIQVVPLKRNCSVGVAQALLEN